MLSYYLGLNMRKKLKVVCINEIQNGYSKGTLLTNNRFAIFNDRGNVPRPFLNQPVVRKGRMI